MAKKVYDKSFEEWLCKRGPIGVGRLLKISPSTVSAWLNSYALPSASKMKLIKRVTKGKIGYDQIIEGSISPLR